MDNLKKNYLRIEKINAEAIDVVAAIMNDSDVTKLDIVILVMRKYAEKYPEKRITLPDSFVYNTEKNLKFEFKRGQYPLSAMLHYIADMMEE